MVSQLSSRLLAGNRSPVDSTNSTDGNSKDGSSGGGQSGYAADREAAKPPVHIDLYLKTKRKATDAEEGEKRRKLNEMHFVAATVRDDLQKGGMKYPEIRLNKPRAIPLASDLDLSRVEVVSSRKVDSSPFLVDTAWNSRLMLDLVTDFGNVYRGLTKLSVPYYDQADEPSTPNGSDAESTSSMSDTESDDSQGSRILVVAARLDDALPKEKNEHLEPKRTTASPSHLISCPSSAAMTMEEALGVCDSARVVVTASPGYTVVHANAAYSRLTGVPLNTIHGKQLLCAVLAADQTSLSLACCAASSSEGKYEQVLIRTKLSGALASLKVVIKVTPIMPSTKPAASSGVKGIDSMGDIREVNNVTHFCVNLLESEIGERAAEGTNEGSSSEDEYDTNPAIAVG